ncbi:imidazolonepropionase [Thalassotalea loyana]|uniref:Imidazolonepropionase n=1 Tax=Thalassotalea loyana TaxID=280483 RepID=A0ABQ6HJQ7_9GAMM|nr:imidazolonepropionase [Thalassotalea loyana]GLX87376.1 imidazolonepropionase [Thalassotalea loyana]
MNDQSTSRFRWQTVLLNVNIATMSNGASDYGEILDGALAIENGKIAWLGKQNELPKYDADEIIDGEGQWLTPGLIDCHTHIVFGGNRANEFEMRLQGKSYEEIAKAGGGIISTVNATREATEAELLEGALKRAKALNSQGVTTLEIKSGYGLDIENELKMLRVASQVSHVLPLTVRRTFLGAHALPPEFKENSQGYIDLVCNEMLSQAQASDLVDAVDVFCEGIAFDADQTEQVFQAASKLNIPVKIHAEQLSNIGGTALAAKYNALSSDHIEFLDEAGVQAMADAGMTAVLLPGAFYFLRETQLPPIELLRKYNVPMAIASDANPGSSPLNSLQLMLNMACTLFRLTPNEALAGVTCFGAKALGLSNEKGQLKVGMDADIAMWDITQPAELCYQFGVNPLSRLFKSGKSVSNH